MTRPRCCRRIRTDRPRACAPSSRPPRGVGSAGVAVLRDFEGVVDPTGYELRVTMLATADEIAGAAELVMGKLDRVPVAVVRGVPDILGQGKATDLVRPA